MKNVVSLLIDVFFQQLQPLVEIDEALTFLRDEKHLASVSRLKRLLSIWKDREPTSLRDPITVWDDMGSTRVLLFHSIREVLFTFMADSSPLSSAFRPSLIIWIAVEPSLTKAAR